MIRANRVRACPGLDPGLTLGFGANDANFPIKSSYIFYIVGTRMGELSFIGPFTNSSVVLAIIIGYFIWDEKPTQIMLSGTMVIILSGIVLLTGEKQKEP